MCLEAERRRKRAGRTRVIAVAALAVLWASPAQAQQNPAQTSTQGQPGFAPSISLMGSVGSNPERVPGDSTRTNFFAAVVELPFRLRSPRWSFALNYRPTYQRYREDETLTSFDHGGSFALNGALSRRTQLLVEGDAYVSDELRGLDATDILLPRTRRVRGGLDAVLEHQFGVRDTLEFRGRYERVSFPDGQLIDSNSIDLAVGYGRALSPRTTALLSASGRLARFDTGRLARSTSVTAGGRFQVARYTRVEVEGGALWIQEDLGQGWSAVQQPGFTVLASLDHTIDRIGLRLRAGRDMGVTSGLGQATIRDRIVGSIRWDSNRWNLLGLAGYARNTGLTAAAPQTPSVKTLTACGQGGVRVNRVLAVVGTVLYAHQLGEFVGAQPVTDTFRVSLGIRLQANGLPMSSAGNQLGFDSIARDARAAC